MSFDTSVRPRIRSVIRSSIWLSVAACASNTPPSPASGRRRPRSPSMIASAAARVAAMRARDDPAEPGQPRRRHQQDRSEAEQIDARAGAPDVIERLGLGHRDQRAATGQGTHQRAAGGQAGDAVMTVQARQPPGRDRWQVEIAGQPLALRSTSNRPISPVSRRWLSSAIRRAMTGVATRPSSPSPHRPPPRSAGRPARRSSRG